MKLAISNKEDSQLMKIWTDEITQDWNNANKESIYIYTTIKV